MSFVSVGGCLREYSKEAQVLFCYQLKQRLASSCADHSASGSLDVSRDFGRLSGAGALDMFFSAGMLDNLTLSLARRCDKVSSNTAKHSLVK